MLHQHLINACFFVLLVGEQMVSEFNPYFRRLLNQLILKQTKNGLASMNRLVTIEAEFESVETELLYNVTITYSRYEGVETIGMPL